MGLFLFLGELTFKNRDI